jgi:hypothetical protein
VRRRFTLLAVLATGAVVLASPSLAAARTDMITVSYGAHGQSWGLDVRVVSLAQRETFPDLLDEYFPHTSVDIDSLPHAVADGEFFDPGALVRTGPGEGNGVYLVPNHLPPLIPSYPFIAHATSDGNANHDVDAGTAQPFTLIPGVLPPTPTGLKAPTGFGAGVAHAHADGSPSARATGQMLSINLGQVQVGSITGDTTGQEVGGSVRVTTNEVMKDITILGVLHVATATATATVETAGPGTATSSGNVTYTGVTVAGVAATIDQDGLHVGGNGVSPSQAQAALQQLDKALSAAGAQLVASQVSTAKNAAGGVTATVDGVGVSFEDPSQSTTTLVSFGHAELQARASVMPAPSSNPVQVPLENAPPPLPTDLTSLPPLTTTTPPATQSRHTSGIAGRMPLRKVVAQVQSGHLLILPFAAVASEVLMGALVYWAWRRRRAFRDDEDLLAL